jgi:hypothetical protein
MHATRFAVWLAVKIETRRKAERIASRNRAQSKGGGGRPVKLPLCHFRASRSRASPPLSRVKRRVLASTSFLSERSSNHNNGRAPDRRTISGQQERRLLEIYGPASSSCHRWQRIGLSTFMRLRAKSRLTTCDADSPNGYRASHALRYRQVPRHLVAVALVLEARGGGRTDVIGQAADDAAGAIVELSRTTSAISTS